MRKENGPVDGRDLANEHFDQFIEVDSGQALNPSSVLEKVAGLDVAKMGDIARGTPEVDSVVDEATERLKRKIRAVVESQQNKKEPLTAQYLLTAFDEFREEQRDIAGAGLLSQVLAMPTFKMSFCDEIGIERE